MKYWWEKHPQLLGEKFVGYRKNGVRKKGIFKAPEKFINLEKITKKRNNV